jgi:serine phosphatase RsbU (regulator of sigma subunit)
MRLLRERHQLSEEHSLLVTHALHHLETTVRLRPLARLDSLSWDSFRAGLVVQLAQICSQPTTAASSANHAPAALPTSDHYDSHTFFRPYRRVGNHFFGGDWFAGHRLPDGSLWVFVADVTGHGYYAYLLAQGLALIWKRCWQAHPERPPQPAELLAGMHDLLSECLPDGIFLESTLVRVTEQGQATVVPAGGTRLFLRAGDEARMVKLRGSWLGFCPPTLESQHELQLHHGDELLLMTDGVFEQLEHLGDADFLAKSAAMENGSLIHGLQRLLEQELSCGPQKDDITMVQLKRRGATTAPATLLTFPEGGAGNVPV